MRLTTASTTSNDGGKRGNAKDVSCHVIMLGSNFLFLVLHQKAFELCWALGLFPRAGIARASGMHIDSICDTYIDIEDMHAMGN